MPSEDRIRTGVTTLAARIAGPIATAVLAELDSKSGAAARFSCAYLAHLHLASLLGHEPKDAPRDSRGRVVSRIPVTTDLAVRDFYGLYAALRRVRPELAAPPDVRSDARFAARLAAYEDEAARAAGPTRVTQLIGLVSRALAGPLALSPPASPASSDPSLILV